jgi:hypothetical protein
MLCEMIALGCVIAHGDIKDKATLSAWKIPDIMRRLEGLNIEFYPRGIRIEPGPSGVELADHNVPQLSKVELIRFWERSGDVLHRGSAKLLLAERRNDLVVDVSELTDLGQKILNLLDQHVISSADKKSHLVVALVGPEGHSAVWVAKSP